MAGYNYAQNIIGLKKGAGDIHELEVEVAGLSASVLEIKSEVSELNNSEYELKTISGLTCEFQKVGYIGSFKMSSGQTDAAFTNDDIIGKVPAGFEPGVNLDFRDIYSSKRLSIDTTGNIIAKESISSGTILRGSFTYAIGHANEA